MLITLSLCLTSCKNEKDTNDSTTTSTTIKPDVETPKKETEVPLEAKIPESNIVINPISHGTLVLEYEDFVIYVDPVGGADAFKDQKKPNIILVTDIHGDHLNVETLEELTINNSELIVPIAVKDKLTDDLKKKSSVLVNSQSIDLQLGKTKINIEAVPMYNLRKEALKFHTKERGNGYVLTLGKERVYISGDTEDIPEMRKLKNIDIAFVCMNLPYTMTVDSAASAVLDFNPNKVYPYHYRGTNGLSDVGKFKDLVNSGNPDIQVIQLDWYPNRDSK